MFDQLDLLSFVPPQPALAPPAKLRPYQVVAVDACLVALRAGHHPVLSLPTGSGKSRVLAALCDALPGRILVATHRQELLEQNAAQLLSYVDGPSDYGIYSAGLARREGEARILFGGIQSIYPRMAALQQAGAFAYVLIDEAHRVPPRSVPSMYGTVFDACPSAQRVGLTATPYRLGSGLLHEGGDSWFDVMPVAVGMRALTPEWLSPLVGVLTAQDIDVSQVRTRLGEFVTSDLSQAACEEQAVTGAVEELCALAQHRRKWLLFCVDVAHTRLVTMALRHHGIAAKYVVGTTDPAARGEILRQFKAGTFQALVNCEVLTTGFDVPDVDCIALLRPTQSKGLVLQMLGRGTRQAPAKQDCIVLDFAGNIERHAPLDALVTLTTSPARAEAEAAAAAHAQAARAREAKHREEASRADPMAARPAAVASVTYGVGHVTYALRAAKKHPGRRMVLVSYFCPERVGQHYVTQFLCVEHGGWAQEQAAAWFLRHGLAVPPDALTGLRLARQSRPPTHIVVREDPQWPRVVMEQFEAEDVPGGTPLW